MSAFGITPGSTSSSISDSLSGTSSPLAIASSFIYLMTLFLHKSLVADGVFHAPPPFAAPQPVSILESRITLRTSAPTSWSISSLKGQLLGIPGSRRFWITFPSFNARFASFFAFRFLIKNYTSLVGCNPHQFSRSVLLANCLSLALCLLWDHTAIEWMVEELWLQKRMDEMGPFWCIPFWERHSQVLRLCFGFACAHSVEACPYSIAKKEEHTHQSQRALTHHSIHLHRQGTSHSLEMECSINAHSCFTRALIPLLLEWTESAMRIQTRYLRKWIR